MASIAKHRASWKPHVGSSVLAAATAVHITPSPNRTCRRTRQHMVLACGRSSLSLPARYLSMSTLSHVQPANTGHGVNEPSRTPLDKVDAAPAPVRSLFLPLTKEINKLNIEQRLLSRCTVHANWPTAHTPGSNEPRARACVDKTEANSLSKRHMKWDWASHAISRILTLLSGLTRRTHNHTHKPNKNDTGNDGDDDDDAESFHLNVGRATDILREDLPRFFDYGLTHANELYSPHVAFVEPMHSGLACTGLRPYRALAETLRYGVWCWFDAVSFEIVSMRHVRVDDGEDGGVSSTGGDDSSSGDGPDRTLAFVNNEKNGMHDHFIPGMQQSRPDGFGLHQRGSGTGIGNELDHNSLRDNGTLDDDTNDSDLQRDYRRPDHRNIRLHVRWVFMGHTRLGGIVERIGASTTATNSNNNSGIDPNKSDTTYDGSDPNTRGASPMPGSRSTSTLPSIVEYEGVFEYAFDSRGRICEHRLRSIHPAPPVLGSLRWLRRPMNMGVV